MVNILLKLIKLLARLAARCLEKLIGGIVFVTMKHPYCSHGRLISQTAWETFPKVRITTSILKLLHLANVRNSSV